MITPYLISIQVGLSQTIGTKGTSNPLDRLWTTGFFKTPVRGEIWMGWTNLVGDGQADLKNHGGRDKAILAYGAEHYPIWRESLQLRDLPYGAFGENLTVVNQSEDSVCIGDIYDLGKAKIQVSQPRQPCWKLSQRWRISDLALQVQKNGRTGWYFRVLKEGNIQPNLPLILQDRPYPQWTVARANQVMYDSQNYRTSAAELAACPLLSSNWQQTLLRRISKNT